MKLKIEEDDIYACPEGLVRGRCTFIREPKTKIRKPCKDQVRVGFAVIIDDKEYLVGKTYCASLRQGTEFYSVLESWIDGDFDRYKDDNCEFDLNLLIGKYADLVINHVKGDQYDKPFVNIAGIFPAGSLTEE